jgi:hypothetical protein
MGANALRPSRPAPKAKAGPRWHGPLRLCAARAALDAKTPYSVSASSPQTKTGRPSVKRGPLRRSSLRLRRLNLLLRRESAQPPVGLLLCREGATAREESLSRLYAWNRMRYHDSGGFRCIGQTSGGPISSEILGTSASKTSMRFYVPMASRDASAVAALATTCTGEDAGT